MPIDIDKVILEKITRNDPSLTDLVLDSPNLVEEDVKSLTILLEKNEYIESVFIKNHKLTSEGYGALLKLVESCPNIISFRFKCLFPLSGKTTMYNRAIQEALESNRLKKENKKELPAKKNFSGDTTKVNDSACALTKRLETISKSAIDPEPPAKLEDVKPGLTSSTPTLVFTSSASLLKDPLSNKPMLGVSQGVGNKISTCKSHLT